MGSDALPSPAPRPTEVRTTAVLAVLGLWTITVPYLGDALGLEVDVPARIEVVDHVVPGVITALAGLYLTMLARRRALATAPSALLASGLCFLSGFWVLATHVPLLGDAADDRVDWGAAIWHAGEALPLVALSLWLVLRATQEPGDA